MSNFYFNRMDRSEQLVYKKILDGVKNHKSNIWAGKIDNDRFAKIVFQMSYDHPELFYVDFSQVFTTIDSHKGVTWNVRYCFSPEAARQKITDMERKIQYLVSKSGLTSNSSVTEKCRWFHDLLVRNVEYEYGALQNPSMHPEAYTIQGVFEKKKAVCKGIALAVVALGDRLGLEAGFVSGEGQSEHTELNNSHAWNIIYTGEGYVHMDVTWDLCISKEQRFTRYDYFMVPDSAIKIDHTMGEPNIQALISGYSFFEQTGRDFTTLEQCSDYITRIFKNGKSIFYFRFKAKNQTVEQSDAKIQAMIMSKAVHGGVLEISNNLKQGIFYYRIRRN